MSAEPTLRLLLIRHGETDWSRAGRFCGRSDPPLNAAGNQQARALAARLPDRGIHTCYTRPIRRAQQTAAIVCDRLAIHYTECTELQEQDFGEWEGQVPEQVAAHDPALWCAWQAGQVAPPSGESLVSVAERVRRWLEGVTNAHRAGTVAAVAHGGVLQAMLCDLLGTPLRPLWPYRLAPGGVAEVWLYPAGAVLVSLIRLPETGKMETWE